MDTFLLVLAIIILIVIAYLIIINQKILKKVITYKRDDEKLKINDERYYELNNKIQLIIVVASIIILIGGFIGYNSIDSIKNDIQETLDDYVDKLNDYDTTMVKYKDLILSLGNERDSTFRSLIATKDESEKTLVSLNQLQNDYRLNAKTYLIKGIKISQNLLKDNTQIGQIFFKDLKSINPKIPDVFIDEPFIAIVGIGEGLVSINKITKEYLEYSYNGFVEADNVLLSILETTNPGTLSQEDKDLLLRLKSIMRNSIKNNMAKSNKSEATSFDLIIIEGIRNH